MKAILCRANRSVVLGALLLLLPGLEANGGPVQQGSSSEPIQQSSYNDPVPQSSYGDGHPEVVLHVRGAS
jgi:hypothetical protein